jgi:choline dehydrogenase-like flavoprotein
MMGFGGAVAVSAGVFQLCHRYGRTYAQIAQNLSAVSPERWFDVCIIGSGPAGAVLGQQLMQNGIRTVILESGHDLRGDSFDARTQKLDVYRSTGSVDYPAVATRLRALGGTANMWTGRCARLHPLDLEANAYTPAGSSWPVTYDELDPYYERGEKTLRVRAAASSKYHPPRKSPLPPSERDLSALHSLLRGVGIEVEDSPTSMISSRRGILARLPIGEQEPGPVRATQSILPDFAGCNFVVASSTGAHHGARRVRVFRRL